MIASLVFVICTLMSALCAVLLFRAYWRSGQRLLFWSAICFVGLLMNNALLFVDVIIFPAVDLSLWRLLPALLGVAALCYGLIAEVD